MKYSNHLQLFWFSHSIMGRIFYIFLLDMECLSSRPMNQLSSCSQIICKYHNVQNWQIVMWHFFGWTIAVNFKNILFYGQFHNFLQLKIIFNSIFVCLFVCSPQFTGRQGGEGEAVEQPTSCYALFIRTLSDFTFLHGPRHLYRPRRSFYEGGIPSRGPFPLTHTNFIPRD